MIGVDLPQCHHHHHHHHHPIIINNITPSSHHHHHHQHLTIISLIIIIIPSPKKWREQLKDCGLDFGDGGIPLLDLRFADDILLFATSSVEATRIVDALVNCLKEVGLALNASKAQPCKTVTTQNGLAMEILDATQAHKWLGCLLSTLMLVINIFLTIIAITIFSPSRDLGQNPGDGPAIVDHQPWSFKSLRPGKLGITLASGGRSWRITTPGLDPPSALLSATWDNCWINGKQLRIWHCSWRATRVCSQPTFVLFRPWVGTVQMAGTT